MHCPARNATHIIFTLIKERCISKLSVLIIAALLGAAGGLFPSNAPAYTREEAWSLALANCPVLEAACLGTPCNVYEVGREVCADAHPCSGNCIVYYDACQDPNDKCCENPDDPCCDKPDDPCCGKECCPLY